VISPLQGRVSVRLVSTIAVAAALLIPSVAQATGTPTTRAKLVLTGSRTASVDVTLRSPIVIDAPASNMTSPGRFFGFYAEAIDKPFGERYDEGNAAGFVTLRDYHPPGQEGNSLNLASPKLTLNAGRYRFYLVADGPTTVRLVISGRDNYSLKPSRPATADAAVRTDILVNPLQASNAQSLVIPSGRSVAFSSIVVGKFRAYVGLIAACLALPGKDCGSATQGGADGGGALQMINPISDFTFRFSVHYPPGVLAPGRYDALQDATNAGTFQFGSGAAFVLGLN
jgi:hypothetical protein